MQHPRRLLLIVFATALVASGSPAAHIVPNACIGGIGLWDSSAKVLRQWGKPIRKEKAAPDVWWHYKRGSVLLTRWGYEPVPDKVIVLVVKTRDPRQRTPAGIGVGSSLRQVRAAYGPCPRNGSCSVDSRPVSGRSTTLEIVNGRVTEVSVALDSSFDDGALQKPYARC